MPDYTTLAAVKAYLKSTAATSDALLSTLITNCSDVIDAYCNREKGFLQADYVEPRDGNGGRQMALRYGPIATVASVVVNGRALPAGSVTQPGFYWADNRVILNGYVFVPGLGNVVISYSAGWPSLRPSLVQAATEYVAYVYKSSDHIALASLSGAGETTAYLTAAMPDGVKSVLNQFRRVVPV
ncbi:hypothetical protein [Nitrospirillum amazonense]|uniref:hypothetical protein n=1 Tax=Nitrospirillum amazonense TaxID=28077 RepID=UPI00241248C4|nr:hypothetical protein [Nitrospirillum amazonense]MDG3442466.1 hypothetical protein [Nitrospirillum amazonense]